MNELGDRQHSQALGALDICHDARHNPVARLVRFGGGLGNR